jgi:hypothetical protein
MLTVDHRLWLIKFCGDLEVTSTLPPTGNSYRRRRLYLTRKSCVDVVGLSVDYFRRELALYVQNYRECIILYNKSLNKR